MNLALYGYWRSSSSWRVRIGLALKGLDYEYRALNLKKGDHRGEDHLVRNPTSQVPVLAVEEDGTTRHLVQSMAILEWLDERFPSPPLLPADAYGRARVRALAEHVNSGIQPYQNLSALLWLKSRMEGGDKMWVQHWLRIGLTALERSVRDGAGRFCHGDEVTLADLYLVPQLYGARRFDVDVEQYPTLLNVEDACKELDAFKKAEPDVQPDAPKGEKGA
jgi:maleylacetoacetate isomerase